MLTVGNVHVPNVKAVMRTSRHLTSGSVSPAFNIRQYVTARTSSPHSQICLPASNTIVPGIALHIPSSRLELPRPHHRPPAPPPKQTINQFTPTMSHCHDEHDHDHGSHNHEHDHTDDLTPALQNLLYTQIDFDKLITLNEDASGSGLGITKKTWAQRLDATPELVSSADEQLLMLVPFTGQVRLHSILLRTSPSPSSPKTLKLYINPDLSMDFSTASDASPTQVLEVSQTTDVQEIPVKRVLWNTTRAIALFFEDNWSQGEDEETRVTYVGFKGDYMRLNKEAVRVEYESAANPKDHTLAAGVGESVGRSIQ
jgi:hypothetical protein